MLLTKSYHHQSSGRRRKRLCLTISAALLLLPSLRALGAPPATAPQIPGYTAVQMNRQTINQLQITAYVNGKPEQFGVDTGASTTVMNEHDALKDGVKLTEAGSPYGQSGYIPGQTLHIGIIDDFRAGAMDFGRGPIALYSSGRSDPFFMQHANESQRMAGLLGADILLHYKAIINVRTRQMFFPLKSGSDAKLGSTLASMGFTRIPLRVENGRSFTVPCTLRGKSGRLLVDTGAFNTVIDSSVATELHLPTQATNFNFGDFYGHRHSANIARIGDLQMGAYHLPAQKIFILSNGFGEQVSKVAETPVLGVLGADLLAAQHGIIDLESMSLFLK